MAKQPGEGRLPAEPQLRSKAPPPCGGRTWAPSTAAAPLSTATMANGTAKTASRASRRPRRLRWAPWKRPGASSRGAPIPFAARSIAIPPHLG